jgi:hypothetical protein
MRAVNLNRLYEIRQLRLSISHFQNLRRFHLICSPYSYDRNYVIVYLNAHILE